MFVGHAFAGSFLMQAAYRTWFRRSHLNPGFNSWIPMPIRGRLSSIQGRGNVVVQVDGIWIESRATWAYLRQCGSSHALHASLPFWRIFHFFKKIMFAPLRRPSSVLQSFGEKILKLLQSTVCKAVLEARVHKNFFLAYSRQENSLVLLKLKFFELSYPLYYFVLVPLDLNLYLFIWNFGGLREIN